MELSLDEDEARMLADALVRRLNELVRELSATDKPEARESLRRDIAALEAISTRLARVRADRRKPGRQPL